MNRKIKFRAWDNDNKEYVFHDESTLMIPCNVGVLWLNPHYVDNLYVIKKERFIVEQFTGLQDKEGNDIYEGDIVKMMDETVNMEGLYEVFWHDEFCRFSFKNDNRDLTFLNADEIEVINNIHECYK